MSGTTASPSSSANAPPGMKSACRSITSRTSLPSFAIADGTGADSYYVDEGAPAPPLESEDDEQRENERQDQIEQPEHQQRRHHIGLGHVRHSFQKCNLQHAEPARRVADQRQREGREKHAEHHEEAGIGRRRQREKDD